MKNSRIRCKSLEEMIRICAMLRIEGVPFEADTDTWVILVLN